MGRKVGNGPEKKLLSHQGAIIEKEDVILDRIVASGGEEGRSQE